ncbi:flavodoxin domain-containing protein [Jannaschia sp. 2305UL9-9]|uniref:flavodoxin domain-containing protein n=1 Tax=Jannaschia sp. 2305UL9-9 TaxID=3121638 RepID=UPI0035285A7F
MKIEILYGTETGNAEMLAEDLEAHLSGDHDVTLTNLSDADPAALAVDALNVLVCSTYGEGDLPASAQPFADRIKATAPDLSQVRFAIFGLGDREYETFGLGSDKLASLLIGQGATQLGERLVHDASGSDLAEDMAIEWVDAQVQTAATQSWAA